MIQLADCNRLEWEGRRLGGGGTLAILSGRSNHYFFLNDPQHTNLNIFHVQGVQTVPPFRP